MNSKNVNTRPYVLGLDIGVNSVGWAILGLDEEQTPNEFIDAGVRIFPAGVDGDVSSGKDASRAAARRTARQARRQLARRAARLAKVFRVLQKHRLLPEGESKTPEERHDILHSLDHRIRASWNGDADHRRRQLLPYLLRAAAAERPVEPHEFGRALYHLAQRRGFLSNRIAKDSEDDRSKVKRGIAELDGSRGEKTLGQYFATLDPSQRRIRNRWTSRKMYLEEFDRMWAAQAAGSNALSKDVRDEIWRAIFFQRYLKSAKHLIGKCELEKTPSGKPRRCALLALPIAQEFRLLQKLNDLEIRRPDGELTRVVEPHAAEQWQTLYDALQSSEELAFDAMRKLLKLPKGTAFNLEEGGEKKLPGNRTLARMRNAFGRRWDEFSSEDQTRIVLEVAHFRKPEALIRRLERTWGLDRAKAEELSEAGLEMGYAAHSRVALEKLVEEMRKKVPYVTAKQAVYGVVHRRSDPVDRLQPVEENFSDLKNPAVLRALTEIRKVVNGLIQRYGKPDIIRIELARDLRRSRYDRKKLAERNRQRERERAKAVRRIMAEIGHQQPRRWMIEKVLLAEECEWTCPYTGRRFEMRDLLGEDSPYDIEHILPRQYLDDSFANKTLCYHEENRNRKRNQLPRQAYGGDAQRWAEILQRVKRFKGTYAREKLRRFEMETVPEGFDSRQLNDTRHNAVKAAEYLASLYGGRWDESGRQRIHTCTGGVTALVRRELNLNGILGDGADKTRDDHRHHAVDAVAVACVSQGMVAKLARSAEACAQRGGRRLIDPIEPPWDSFLDDIRTGIFRIVVSFRQGRRVGGSLHADTNYSPELPREGGGKGHRVRKPLEKLTASMVDQIVDAAVRKAVKDALAAAGTDQPKNAFANERYPFLPCRNGKDFVPIRSVRIHVNDKPKPVGKGVRVRFVSSGQGTNHHCVVYADLDEKGNQIRWKHLVVTRLEAYERMAAAQRARRAKADSSSPTPKSLKIVQRDLGDGKRFLFSLMADDCLELDDEEGKRAIYRVAKISAGEIQLWEHWRAKPDNSQRTVWNEIRTADSLRRRGARKVVVLPTGAVHPCND